jgi:hypothetical protein
MDPELQVLLGVVVSWMTSTGRFGIGHLNYADLIGGAPSYAPTC